MRDQPQTPTPLDLLLVLLLLLLLVFLMCLGILLVLLVPAPLLSSRSVLFYPNLFSCYATAWLDQDLRRQCVNDIEDLEHARG